MAGSILILAGPCKVDLTPLETVAREFGWTVAIAKDLRDQHGVLMTRFPAAVIFHREAFGPGCSWDDAIRFLNAALPGARPVLLHGFSESIDWPQLSDAGTFHAIRFPLQEGELRQSLGFVWEAERRGEAATHETASSYARSLHAIARATESAEEAESVVVEKTDAEQQGCAADPAAAQPAGNPLT